MSFAARTFTGIRPTSTASFGSCSSHRSGADAGAASFTSANGGGGEGGRPDHGDAAVYAEDQKAVQDFIQVICDYTARIRKEAGSLVTVASLEGSRQKIQDASRAARASAEEARYLLERLSRNSTVGSTNEQNMKRLRQQKLSESLVSVSNELEAALKAYDSAVADRERQLCAEAASFVPAATGVGGAVPSGGRGGSRGGLQLQMVSAGAAQTGGLMTAQQQQQQQQLTAAHDAVAQAELETHSSVVDEYTQDVSTLQRDIQGLQRAMVDLADHVTVQGECLDNIEANMLQSADRTEGATEQLVQANQTHRRGSKLLYCLLSLAVVFAVAVIVAVVMRSKDHNHATS